jgi:hypothetical protein
MGDSRGRWEGTTLVVDTTNFLGRKTGLIGNGGGTPFSEDLHIIERFTRTDAETIRYELRIDDPQTYTKPIRIMFPIRKEPGYQNFERHDESAGRRSSGGKGGGRGGQGEKLRIPPAHDLSCVARENPP